MASAASTYGERLRLVDSFEEYKDYFSKAHLKFLAQEALELNQGGAEKLRYILDLASRCKTGVVVTAELLAKQIEKEYWLPPLLQEQEGGVKEGPEQEWADMETDNEEAAGQEDEEQDCDEEEEEVPLVSQEVKDLIAQFGTGCLRWQDWRDAGKPFAVPDQGCLLNAHDIETLRPSTSEDFDSATPKSMPVYTNGNSLRGKVYSGQYSSQVRSYHCCRKVAVSFDGKIYRATDAEIEAAFQNKINPPSCSAATYVKAVQEVCRRVESDSATVT